MSRPGKIARLPRTVRDTLNFRLQDGEQGPELLAWLNARPEVQAVLTAHFKGQPVNAQNLSEWRQGGYADWCQDQRISELAERVHELKPEIDAILDKEALADCLTQSTMLVLARALRETSQIGDGLEQTRVSLAVVNAVLRVRRMQRETDRDRREVAKEARALRETERREALPKAPPPPAPAAPAPRPPAPSVLKLTSTEDAQIDAVWASAMKLAKSTPLAPVPATKPFGPKLPAALQAA